MKWCLWVIFSLAFVIWEAKGQVCEDRVDIGFVLDGSSGLTQNEFDRLRILVINYLRQKSAVPTVEVHAGVVVVSNDVYGRLPVTQNLDDFERYLSGVRFQAGAGIQLGTGIEVSFSDLIIHPGPPNTKKMLIVLVSQESTSTAKTRSSSEFARDINIEMFAVGLNDMPSRELQIIADGPENVFRILDLSTATSLPNIILNLAGVDCFSGTTPATPSTRPTTPTTRPTTPSTRPTTPSTRATTPSTRRTTPSTRRTTPTTRPTTPTTRPTTPRTRPTPPTTRQTPRTTRRTTPRPTTPRRTTPTTTSTTFRPLPTESLCQEARIIGTVGYRGHPTEPESYIQCYYPQQQTRRKRSTRDTWLATNAIAVIRQCPFGLFWNQGTRTCEMSSMVTPVGDKCSDGGRLSRAVNGNCRGYFSCVNGHSVASCCPAGYAYSPVGCTPCANCMDNCLTITTRQFACNRYPAWDDVSSFLAYKWDRDGGSYVKQSCPESCYFNLPSCDCTSRPWETQNGTDIPCGATIDIPFFVRGSTEYRLEGVNILGGVAILSGNSYIHISLEDNPDFASYGGPLAIEFKYREAQEITMRQALLSSSPCPRAGYLLVTVDRESILVEVSTDAGTLISLAVPTVGLKPTEWKTLRMVDNNEYITLSVSNGRDAYIARTRAPASPYIQCGLDVGAAEFVDSFQGSIEQFTFYQCLPQTMLG